MDEKKLEELKEACADYMEFMRSEDYNEDELSYYENDIFESALEVFYGDKVWDEINKIMLGN